MVKIKGVFFDMDGTIVRYPHEPFHSSWDAIGSALGLAEEWNALISYYLPRKNLYSEWYEKQVTSLRGVQVSRITDKIFPVPYAPGIRAVAPYINSRYKTGIITSGVNVVADRVRQELEFDFCICNELEVKNGVLTGRTTSFMNLWDKGETFLNACRTHKLDPSEVCFVGDHVNDVPVFRLAGMAIAFNPKEPKVAKAADYVIHDFEELRGII